MSVVFRTPAASDWSSILRMANRSVAHVAEAGDQNEWLSNRRYFLEHCIGEHFVASDEGRIVGYGSVEPVHGVTQCFRLFVVTEISDRDRVGTQILEKLFRELVRLDATEARFVEYAEDTAFIAFLETHGFHATHRVALGHGLDAIVLVRAAPF